MSYVDLPSMKAGGSVEEQVNYLKNYLYKLATDLNHNIDNDSVDVVLDKAVNYYKTETATGGLLGQTVALSGYDKYVNAFNSLRDLIIGNATTVVTNETEPIVNHFQRQYEAADKEYGKYSRIIETDIIENADGITVISDQDEKVDGGTEGGQKDKAGYIKIGWINADEYKWGIDIGQLHDDLIYKTESGKVVEFKKTKRFIRLLPESIQFYIGDKSYATISSEYLDFPNAKITGGEIKIGSANNGVYPFQVDKSGKVTASDIHITGGSITVGDDFKVDNTGKVIAKNIQVSGKSKIGGWSIDGSVLKGSYTQELNIPLTSIKFQMVKTIRLDPDPTTNFISVSTTYKTGNTSIAKDSTFVLDKDGRISSHLNFSGTGKYLRFYNGIAGNDVDSVNELYTNIIGYSSNNNLILGDPSFGVGETSGYGVFLFGRAAYFSDINKASGNNTYTNYELWHQGNAPVKVNQQIQSWINNNIYIYHESKNTGGKYTGGKIYAQLGGTSTFTAEQLIGFTQSGNLAIGYSGFAGNINIYGAKVNLNGNQLALKSDIPSLSGYATEAWVNSKNYLTSHQSLSGYFNTTNILTHVQNGRIKLTVNANNTTLAANRTITFTFTNTFTSAPRMVCGAVYNSTDNKIENGLAVYPTDLSTTGATIKLTGTASQAGAITCYFYWIATNVGGNGTKEIPD